LVSAEWGESDQGLDFESNEKLLRGQAALDWIHVHVAKFSILFFSRSRDKKPARQRLPLAAPLPRASASLESLMRKGIYR
jgi:hypothetical protein